MTDLHLSHYHIEAELGRGGMGVVYKALDTTLDRIVALKVLPAAALSSDDDRARFFREAKAAARLHHPNIATVFQIDEAAPHTAGEEPTPGAEKRLFIAMEFVEGRPLRELTLEAPLNLEQVVSIASEIAEALKAAHEKEIVHRDIKSANVMLTSDGVAKVLDFGLAKTNESTMLTKMGSTLGTVAYMSPEQARGEVVDSRTDLYSLGVVMYEMIAGRLPFEAGYEQAVVYSILNEDPEPLTSMRTGVPMALEDIVAKCLAKDREYRYPTANALLVDLKRVDVTSSSRSSRVVGRPTGGARPGGLIHSPAARGMWPLIAAMGVFLGLVAGLAVGRNMTSTESLPLEKLTLHIEGVRGLSSPSVAPDGRYLVFSGVDTAGWSGLFLYDVREGETERIDRTEGGFYPWVSPSGDRIAYSVVSGTAGRPNGLYVVDVPSGAPRLLMENAFAGYWEDEDHIVFDLDGEVMRIELSTDVVELVSTADSDDYIIFPGPVIPGTRMMLANLQTEGALDNDPRLLTIDLLTGRQTMGDRGIINPQPFPGGLVLYQYADDFGPLVARRFSASTTTFIGAPVDVVPTMFFGTWQAGADGSLLMAPDMARELTRPQQFFLVDLETKTVARFPLPDVREREIEYISLSPDGRTALLSSASNRSGLAYVMRLEPETGVTSQETVEMEMADPSWSSDGRHFYASYHIENEKGEEGEILGRQNLTGDGRVDTISVWMESIGEAADTPYGLVVSATLGDGRQSVGILSFDTGEFEPFTDFTGQNASPAVSPGGEFVAYLKATGNSWRIAVRTMRTGEETVLLIDSDNLQWSPEGDFLYYFVRERLYRLPVSIDGTFQTRGEPESVLSSPDGSLYVIGADAVVMLISPNVSFEQETEPYSRLLWWKNYAAELDRILPRE